MLLVRSGPVIRDLGGSVRIWGDNGPVLISYFYDGAVPVKVFQNRSQSGFYMDNCTYVAIGDKGERHSESLFVNRMISAAWMFIVMRYEDEASGFTTHITRHLASGHHGNRNPNAPVARGREGTGQQFS